MPLATLDASALKAGTEEEKLDFGNTLFTALARDGAVKLVNTTLQDGDIAKAFQTCKDFFHLPPQVKSQIANDPHRAQQRGWSKPGEEKTWYLESVKKGGPAPKFNDSRESIDIGCISDTLFPNKWLPDDVQPPQHRSIMENLFEGCSTLSSRLLEVLAMACRLPEDAFTACCSHGASVLRSNNYAPVDIGLLDAGDIGRAWPHTDFGIISLVFPGAVGGLEYEIREGGGGGKQPGAFEPVGYTSESDIVLLTAETMQRWTNDELKACLHRVQKPLPEEMDGMLAPERTSMVFFCKADRHSQVGPMKEFVGEGGPRYPEMTALEYQEQRNSAHYPG